MRSAAGDRAALAAGVRTVADAPSSGYSAGPAVSVSPIGGGEHVAQCQCQGPRSRRPACSQRARPPHYWQAGTSKRSSMGIEEDGGIGALLQVVCDVWMRWPLSLRAPVREVQRAAVCVGCARERAAGSCSPYADDQGVPVSSMRGVVTVPVYLVYEEGDVTGGVELCSGLPLSSTLSIYRYLRHS